jgi:HD superfamily phosphohydrolase
VPSRFKLFNDPVHGFVSVPKGLVLRLVETPVFQRLRRIRQLGLGFLVFPGAVHTRFEHALGAMALMHEALGTLREKGAFMATDEVEAALAAALLHDVGHGPFSHTLEEQLILPAPDGTPHHHERMSRALIGRHDRAFGGALALTLRIFDGTYERSFFHTLVASQLDMDRLDYLRRDSFYTGVAEGVVGVERILKTMRVVPEQGGPDARVVIEAKGAYAVENFILARRQMFWQVYLHKTVVAADHLLRAAFARARDRWADGPAARDPALAATAPALAFFLDGRVTTADLDDEAVLDHFVGLDDTDLLYSLKRWAEARDPVLADLARRFLDRDLFRTHYLPAPLSADDLDDLRARVARRLVEAGLSTPAEALADAAYYVAADVARLDAYRLRGDAICILERDGRLRELSEAEDVAAVGALAGVVEKPYVCAPKEIGGVAEFGSRLADGPL